MDWTSLLKTQQADFLLRLKKTRTPEVSLLESQAKGCHAEIINFWGEALEKLLATACRQGEILAKNPPPTPPDYPEFPEWSVPFPTYFQQQAQNYILREQIVEQVIAQLLGKIIKKLPQDPVKNMLLDDEGNLQRESKFSYFLPEYPQVKILVCVADKESFNSLKKDKIKWSVTPEDGKIYQLFIFLCLLYPINGKRGYEKQAIVAGFLTPNQMELGEPKIDVTPSQLLYAGGLSWYLETAITKGNQPPWDEVTVAENTQTVPPEHPLKKIIGDWECWQTLKGHTKGINCLAFCLENRNGRTSALLASGSRGETKLWDLHKGELICTLSEHPWMLSGLVDEINALAFSPDGQSTLEGHRGEVCAITLSPDGQTIASGSADKTIKLWYLPTGELLGRFTGHAHTVTAVAFTACGEMLVSGSLDKTIKIWQRSGMEECR